VESAVTGWELLELFKLDPRLSTLPFIVCSADVPALGERATYLKSKGCDVLAKPFDLDDLLAVVEKRIGGPSGGARWQAQL
jgi:CheY-like chemotaxis protein